VDTSRAEPRSSQPWSVLLCFACTLSYTSVSVAQVLAQTVEDEVSTLETEAPHTSTSADDGLEDEQQRARDAELARELTLRLQSINEMQGSLGIYSPQLQEAYADLGALYVEQEDFDAAIAVYNDALQISRINSGLYGGQQIPIIDSMIHSNSQLRSWQAVDDLHELRYHISSRLFAINEIAYLKAAEDFGAWKLTLLRQNLLDLGYRSYSRSAEDLSAFFERLLENFELQEGTRQENLISIISGKSEADLVLARAVASTPYNAFEGTVSRYRTEQRCRNVRRAGGGVQRECVNIQVENPRYRQSQMDAKQFAMNRSARVVRESIDRLRQISQQSSELTREERNQLDAQIAELETETIQLQRQARSRRRF